MPFPRSAHASATRAWLLSLGIALGLTLALTLADDVRTPDDRALFGALVRAVGPRRLVEPRLVGGFAYGPCTSAPSTPRSSLVPRSACSEPPRPGTRGFFALRDAQRNAEIAASRRPSPLTLHAAAVARFLASPNPSALDSAVATLEAAAARAPHSAAILSDLAAVYYVRGQKDDEPIDLLRALSAADRAVAAERTLAEARFNRALVLQALHADTAARTAWLEYLALDAGSDWAIEAGDRLLALNLPPLSDTWDDVLPTLDGAAARGDERAIQPVVARFRQNVREHAERDVLASWAAAQEQGRVADAEHFLAVARSLGAALAHGGGDRMVAATVAAIDRAARAADSGALLALARGHRAFRDGYERYNRIDSAQAILLLAAARADLARGGSPFAFEAAFYLACAEYNRDDYAGAARRLDELAHELAGRPYPSLRAYVEWMRGLTRWVRGDPVASLQFYEAAASLFAKAGEPEGAAFIQILLSASLEELGRYDDSWRSCYRALAVARHFRNPRRRFTASAWAADFNLHRGKPGIALAFQTDAVRYAREANSATLADALLWRGLMSARTGDRKRAENDFARARRVIRRNADRAAVARNSADLALARGDLLAESDPPQAVMLLSDALRLYATAEHHLYALLAHQARARAYRKMAQLDRAEEDLVAALAAYENVGRDVDQPDALLPYLARFTDLFDQMIAFQALDRRRDDRAFEYADRARTKVLPAYTSNLELPLAEKRLFLGADPAPIKLAELRQRLPPATVLVQYSVLPDRLLVWVVRRHGMTAFTKKVSLSHLAALVARFRPIAGRGEGPGGLDAANDLSELLLEPWIGSVGVEEAIVFVPDKALLGVPFACLRRSGQYLVERNRVAIAPSATLFVGGAGVRDEAEVSGGGLVVGDPAFERRRFQALPTLAASAREARDIAALHPGSRLLVGGDATKREFLANVRRYQWVHFAGHAIVNAKNPLLSMLVLAPTPATEDAGVLYAWEIYQLDLRGTRLVVLSGCGTGDGPSERSEGFTSLARAFLAAGAPVVVGSLWDIDDESTRKLLVRFHTNLHAGADPAEALRQAQISFLASPDPSARRPASWGAFEVFVAGTR